MTKANVMKFELSRSIRMKTPSNNNRCSGGCGCLAPAVHLIPLAVWCTRYIVVL